MRKNNTLAEKLVNATDSPLTVEKVADYLGITKWGVLKKIERGQLPAHKNGRRWYMMRSELVEYLKTDNPST